MYVEREREREREREILGLSAKFSRIDLGIYSLITTTVNLLTRKICSLFIFVNTFLECTRDRGIAGSIYTLDVS